MFQIQEPHTHHVPLFFRTTSNIFIMIPCILMLISVGVGLVILVLFITSFLLTIFAWIIFGTKARNRCSQGGGGAQETCSCGRRSAKREGESRGAAATRKNRADFINEYYSPLGGDCVICCVRAADTLVMPCKHLALCGACSSKMRTGSSGPEGRCPLCRAHIVDKMKIFRS
ncbi:hypothetical protein P167DRAFT_282657 [Morchella conica CCBAS932]|uniref:RING-type domain-containing protein n=1 Tax=Morchella conica CCBAS932 TaxID=1392247 RepID=A0A3N4KHP2_9PEZI|nr:hypothetical protein P167DRAFT_282657 [Morchella conica CCBAS932]